jgi:hypothetical protein
MCIRGLKNDSTRLSHHDHVKQKHAKRVKGRIEYVIPGIGVCDIVSDKYAIEVKSYTQWKHGMGQAQAYAIGTARQPVLHLYDTAHKDMDMIKIVCARCDVLVTIEEDM